MGAPRRLAFLVTFAALFQPGHVYRIANPLPQDAIFSLGSAEHRQPALAVQQLMQPSGAGSYLEASSSWSELTVRYHVAHSPALLAVVVLIPMFIFISLQGAGQHAEGSKYRNFVAAEGRPEALSEWQVIVRGMVIAAPCGASGYNIALLSSELPSLEEAFGGHVSLLGVVAASYCMGCVVGALVEAFLAERFGRVRTLRWLTAVLYVAQALMLAAPTFGSFVLGRFLMGAASGCSMALGPLFAAEISPKDLRGLLVSLTEWAMVLGMLVGYGLTAFPGITFREHALLGTFIPFATMLFMPLLAESPRWLAQQGRVEEARSVLELYLADSEEAAQTAVALGAKAGTGVNSDPLRQYVRLLQDPFLRARLFWPALLMCLTEMVGSEVSDDYCVRFLNDVGVPSRPLVTGFTMAAVFVKTLGLGISGCLLDRYGRKSWLLYSLAAQTVALLVMVYGYGHSLWVTFVIAWLVYNLSYGTGVGNISLVVLAESFPDPSARVAAVSMCYVLSQAVAAVMTGLYPMQHALIGTTSVFFLWAVCAAVAFVASAALMTERSGTILEHS